MTAKKGAYTNFHRSPRSIANRSENHQVTELA